MFNAVTHFITISGLFLEKKSLKILNQNKENENEKWDFFLSCRVIVCRCPSADTTNYSNQSTCKPNSGHKKPQECAAALNSTQSRTFLMHNIIYWRGLTNTYKLRLFWWCFYF